jgi:hypothetical protein
MYSTKESPLGIVNIVVYFSLILIFEIVFRFYQGSAPTPLRRPFVTMTLLEFN